MMYKSIEVVPYNADWPKHFESEAAAIKEKLGHNCVALHHIGSTSVPDLSAKPVIDMLVVAKNPSALIENLESLGYAYKGELNIPFRFYFNRKGETVFHLHMYEPDSSEIELNLSFRDYLRTHPQTCAEYTGLKLSLAKEQQQYKDAPLMFSHYTLGKNIFIQKILQHAGFDGLRLMHCTHYTEWEAAKRYRQKYFFDKVPISDPYTWTFNHREHVHFVLYKGIKIIGYAHLQRWPEQRVAMRIIVIDENFRGQGFGGYLLKLCEKWLQSQRIKSLHIEASPQAEGFYRHYNYCEMDFNDPDNYQSNLQDVEMGKIL